MSGKKPRAVKPDDLTVLKTVVAPVIVVGSVISAAALIGDWVEANYPGHYLERGGSEWHEGGLINKIGIFLIIYSIILITSRASTSGVYYVCEVLWACNSSMLLASVGMCTQRPLLVGAATTMVGIDQLSWYIDCIAYLLTGKFPLGVAKYLVSPSLSRIHFWTSFHHLFFLPLCFFSLRKIGMPSASYPLCVFVTSLLVIAARIFTPFAVNEGKSIKVFNINLSYEFWDDVKIPLVHAMDHRPAYLYLPYLLGFCNIYLNGIPVALIYYGLNLLRDSFYARDK